MNSTAVTISPACMAYERAAYPTKLSASITAMASFTLDGKAHHFDTISSSVKSHPDMQQIAAWLRQGLLTDQWEHNGKRLQGGCSIRCAPHMIGALAGFSRWFHVSIKIELNSANDSSIIDAEGERVLRGGPFYGCYIGFTIDSMRNAVANLAYLLDGQMALLVDIRYNQGFPEGLSGSSGSRAAINHGLKALQISPSLWPAEALKLAAPTSVSPRPTERHTQREISMGGISACDCLRMLELTEQVAVASLITIPQGVWLRCRQNSFVVQQSNLVQMMQIQGEDISVIEEGRQLEPDLHLRLERIQTQAWELYV